MHTQMKSKNCACGIEGVMEKRGVKVGETFAIADICRIEVKLQRIIDMIEDQKIVVHGQENANGDVDFHVKIDGGEILYLTYYN